MKIIQSMLAIFGVAQAGYNSDATYDCGYHSDINDQIVREIGLPIKLFKQDQSVLLRRQLLLHRSPISLFDSRAQPT